MIVLASGSTARRDMLRSAGVPFDAANAPVDEDAVKAAMRQDGASIEDTAIMLADLKATTASRLYPGRLVVGADQMLEVGGVWLDKPADQAAAKAQLQSLRGRTHRLVSAVVVARDHQRLWHHADQARLTMRDFSDDFLDEYLVRGGSGVLGSVGAYKVEGLGIQLFSKIEGDYFTILGMPLLALMDFLRNHKELAQ